MGKKKVIFEYDHGDIVYMKNDPEQLPHEVVGMTCLGGTGTGSFQYHLSYLGDISVVYNFQISPDKDLTKENPLKDDE